MCCYEKRNGKKEKKARAITLDLYLKENFYNQDITASNLKDMEEQTGQRDIFEYLCSGIWVKLKLLLVLNGEEKGKLILCTESISRFVANF